MFEVSQQQLEGVAEQVSAAPDRHRPHQGPGGVEQHEARRGDAADADGKRHDRSEAVEKPETEDQRRAMAVHQAPSLLYLGGPERTPANEGLGMPSAEVEKKLIAHEAAGKSG